MFHFFSSFFSLLIWASHDFLSILEANRLIQLFLSIAIHGYYNPHNKTEKKDARNISSMKVKSQKKTDAG